MPKFDYPQTNFTAGEISPKLKGRWDIARYQNGAEIIENGLPVVHGGVDRRDGFGYLAPSKLNEDDGVRMIGYVYSSSQSYMLEFGHQYVRLFASNGAVILNPGLTPLELVSPYTRDQLSQLNYVQRGDTLLLFHGDVPTHRLRRLSAVSWSLQPVPFITEPFAELGHSPDSTLTVSALTVGAGRTFTAGAGTVPNAPTIGAVTPLNAAANVVFTPPAVTGGSTILDYTVTSTPGGITAVGTSSPIRITGLANNTAYTFKVKARNLFGFGAESAASASATPLASLPGVVLSVTAAPADLFGGVKANGTISNNAGPTASATAGIGPYTYNWVKVSGDAGITVQTGNQAQLIYRSVGTNRENYGTFRCDVTDSVGTTGQAFANIGMAHGTPP